MAFSFPDGVRFSPDDKELIASYLRRRVEDLPFSPGFVLDCDVYHTEPWKLPMDDFKYGKEGEFFYFTPRHRAITTRKNDGCRVRRTAGEGYWDGESHIKPIHDGCSEVIGHKTSLVFKCKDKVTGSITKTDWIMHEYLLHSPDNKFQEIGLCRIRYKGKNGDVETCPSMIPIKRMRIALESSESSAKISRYDDVHVGNINSHSSGYINAPETTHCIEDAPPNAASSDLMFHPTANICTSRREAAGTSSEIEMPTYEEQLHSSQLALAYTFEGTMSSTDHASPQTDLSHQYSSIDTPTSQPSVATLEEIGRTLMESSYPLADDHVSSELEDNSDLSKLHMEHEEPTTCAVEHNTNLCSTEQRMEAGGVGVQDEDDIFSTLPALVPAAELCTVPKSVMDQVAQMSGDDLGGSCFGGMAADISNVVWGDYDQVVLDTMARWLPESEMVFGKTAYDIFPGEFY